MAPGGTSPLREEGIAALRHAVDDGVRAGHFPGGVALVAHGGEVECHQAGEAVRWSDAGIQLAPADRVPVQRETIFDLASLSKLITTVACLQLVERGHVDLDAPAATYLPELGTGGSQRMTSRQLLTHTAGLPDWIDLLGEHDTIAARRAAVVCTAPIIEPGSQVLYSDLGLMVLGWLVEAVSGQWLADYVTEHITAPLGMAATTYRPPAGLRARIAATEVQQRAGRGLVHGEVHDDNAWALGGVAGHAGLFAPVDDVVTFALMLLEGGRGTGTRLLQPATVSEMWRDHTGNLPSAMPGRSTVRRGLGLELAAEHYHGALRSIDSAGHTGFTGTSLVIDPHRETIAVLLSNRVHPSRKRQGINDSRQAVADAAAMISNPLPN